MASGALRSAHDISEGGIAVALAECCIAGRLGATVALPEGLDPFAEAAGRAFVVSGAREAIEQALPSARVLGTVGGDTLSIGPQTWALADLRGAFSALGALFA